MKTKLFFIAAISSIALTSFACSSISSGWSALHSGDVEKAQTIAIKELAAHPKDAEVYRLITATQLAKNQNAQALSAAQQAARLEPQNPENLKSLQAALQANQYWPAFCETSAKLNQLEPIAIDANNQPVYLEAAKRSVKANQGREAYSCFEIIKNYSPEITQSNEYTAAASAQADALRHAGKYTEAIELLDTLQQNDDERLYHQATLLYEIQKKSEADALLKEYCDHPTDHPQTKNQRTEKVAEFYETQHQPDTALQYYLKSDNPNAILSQSRLYLKLGNETEARNALQRFIDLPLIPPKEAQNAATQLTRSGWATLAADLLEKAMIRFPDNKDIAVSAATTAYQIGNKSRAKEIWDKLTEKNPENHEIYEQAFYFYAQRNMKNEAYYFGSKAAELPSVDAAFLPVFAEVCAKNNDFFTMEKTLSNYIQAAEKNGSVSASARVTSSEIAAKYYLWDTAIQWLEPAFKSTPASRPVAMGLSSAYERQQKFNNAFEVISKWIQSNNNDPDLYIEMAKYYQKSQQDDYMFKMLKSVENTPGYEDRAQLLYAKYYLSTGEQDKFRQSLENIIEKAADRKKGYETVIHYVDEELFLLDLAIEYSQRRIAEFPDDAEFYPQLARLYLMNDRDDEALETLDTYFEKSDDKYNAAYAVCAQLSRFNLADLNVPWLRKMRDRVSGKDATDLDYLIAKEMWNRTTRADTAEKTQLRAEASRLSMQWLEKTQNTRQIEDMAYLLHTTGNEEEAVKAYEMLDALSTMTLSQRQTYIITLHKAGHFDEAKANINKFESTHPSENDTLQLTNALVQNNAAILCVPMLDKLISSDNAQTRLNAYRQRVEIAIQQNDLKTIHAISDEAERMASPLTQFDTLTATLNTYERIEDWQHAVEKLELLHAQRPADNSLLLKLLKYIQIEGKGGYAERCYQQWFSVKPPSLIQMEAIADFYKQAGNFSEALPLYRTVVQQSAHPSIETLNKWIPLEIAAGNLENADQGIQQLKDAKAWDDKTILTVSDAFHNAGFTEQAKNLLSDAIATHPENTDLHIARIAQALSTGNTQAALKAIQDAQNNVKATAIIRVLLDYNAIDEAQDLIENMNAQYLYNDALLQTLKLEDSLMQAKGAQSYLMALKAYMTTSDESYRIIPKMAIHELTGNQLTNAFTWFSRATLDDPGFAENYAMTAFRLWSEKELSHQMMDNVMARLHAFENTLPNAQKIHFQQNLLNRMQQWANIHQWNDAKSSAFISAYIQSADNTDILNSLNNISEALKTQRLRDATIEIMSGPFSQMLTPYPDQAIADCADMPLTLLAQYSLNEEAIDICEQWFKAQEGQPERQYNIVKTAFIIDRNNKRSTALFRQLTPEPTAAYLRLSALSKHPVATDTLKNWLFKSSYDNRDAIIHALIAQSKEAVIAPNAPDISGEVRKILEEYRDSTIEKTQTELSYTSHALLLQHAELASYYSQNVLAKIPSVSAFYLNDAEAQNLNKKHQKAAEQIENAALRSNNPFETRLKAFAQANTTEEAKTALPAISAMLEQQPGSLTLGLLKLKLELLSNNTAEAQTLASHILQTWSDPITRQKTLQLFLDTNQAKAIQQSWLISEQTYDNLEFLLGKIALLQNNPELAVQHFNKAVELSPSPLIIQLEVAQTLQNANQLQRAEQFVEKAIQDNPKATETYHYRALLNIENGQLDAARSDYLEAIRNSHDPRRVLKDVLLTLLRKNSDPVPEYLSPCSGNSASALCYMSPEDVIIAISEAYQAAGKSAEGLRAIASLVPDLNALTVHSYELASKLSSLARDAGNKSFALSVAQKYVFANSEDPAAWKLLAEISKLNNQYAGDLLVYASWLED